jgi:sugar phosphate isomerase/epimerase
MQRLLSTYLYVDQKLNPATLSEIERAGFNGVQIFCSSHHFNYRDADSVREIADWFRDHKMKLDSLHAPSSRDLSPGRESSSPISICDPERVRRLDAVDEMKRALDVAEVMEFPLMVLHLGGSRDADNPRVWDAAFTSLEHLTVFAKQRGVTLAVENTPGEIATPAKLRHFIEDTRIGGLKLCFDSGHAHMEGEAISGAELVRDLAASAHIHDNHGEKDEHLLPYSGTIDWKKLLAALPKDLPFVIELKTQNPGPTLDEIRRVTDRLEEERNARS